LVAWRPQAGGLGSTRAPQIVGVTGSFGSPEQSKNDGGALGLIGPLSGDAYFRDLSIERAMTIQVNQEYVNDTAKLMMHRLIARAIGRDPSVIEKARISLDRSSSQHEGFSFIPEWSGLLRLPPSDVRRRLTSRDEEMTRLRLSSPFVVADGIDFSDIALRRRVWRAAKRLAVRSAVARTAM
jgi:hypothetical protein